MDFIVVYDKSAVGSPIVAVHSQRFTKEDVTLQDIHPDDDPSKRGIVVVPGEIVSRMVLRKYKRGKNGQLLEKPVLVVKTKVVTSIPDSAVKQNIVFFSEPIAELVSVTDLSGNGVRAKALSSEKGVIGVGESSGVFSVVCNVTTGVTEPEVVSEKQNWRWKRDAEGNIVGMELIEEQE